MGLISKQMVKWMWMKHTNISKLHSLHRNKIHQLI